MSDSYLAWCSVSIPQMGVLGSWLHLSWTWNDQGWGGQKGYIRIYTGLEGYEPPAAGARFFSYGSAPHTSTAESASVQLPAWGSAAC